MKPDHIQLGRWAVWVAAVFLAAAWTPSARAQNILAWGDNSYGQTNVPASATNVLAIAAGDNHSLALKDDGTVVG